MDFSSVELNKEIEWDDSVEGILSEIGDESQINAYMHKKSQSYYTKQNIKYQLPIIILSALSGTGNFVSTNFPDYSKYIILAVGGVSIFTSILSSVAQFLKVSQLSESHRMSYLSWEKFHSNIKFQLNKKRGSRDNLKDFLSVIVPEYQRLKEISAEIPKSIYDQVRSNKKNLSKMQVPYLLNGFHPVVAYKEAEEIVDDSGDNGLINIQSLHLNIEEDDDTTA
uniref:SLATT domain-containing protein n=1 Tax=viral metagenome TaxID=1070528 RepID=A0A6C0EZH9_9ZZZZ